MATYHGHSGVITVAGNAVAHVTAFSLTLNQVEYPEDTAMGAAARTYKTGGPVSNSGSMTYLLDRTDTTGQNALVANAALTAIFYPDGNASGKPTVTGSILIQSKSRTQSMGDIVEEEATFVFNGAATEGTVGG